MAGLSKEFCLGILLGRGVLRCWFFGVGVDKVDSKGRRDCCCFPILINEFAGL